MRTVLWATIGVALCGCATARLSHAVKPYVGRDIHELTAHFGRPTGEREAAADRKSAADRVFVWSTSAEGVLPGGAGTAGTITVQHECTLEVTVSAENLILSYEVEGSDAGCAAFRRHLGR